MLFTLHFGGVNGTVTVQCGTFTLCLRSEYKFSYKLPYDAVSLLFVRVKLYMVINHSTFYMVIKKRFH